MPWIIVEVADVLVALCIGKQIKSLAGSMLAVRLPKLDTGAAPLRRSWKTWLLRSARPASELCAFV
jgi:hypothetical protein